MLDDVQARSQRREKRVLASTSCQSHVAMALESKFVDQCSEALLSQARQIGGIYWEKFATKTTEATKKKHFQWSTTSTFLLSYTHTQSSFVTPLSSPCDSLCLVVHTVYVVCTLVCNMLWYAKWRVWWHVNLQIDADLLSLLEAVVFVGARV